MYSENNDGGGWIENPVSKFIRKQLLKLLKFFEKTLGVVLTPVATFLGYFFSRLLYGGSVVIDSIMAALGAIAWILTIRSTGIAVAINYLALLAVCACNARLFMTKFPARRGRILLIGLISTVAILCLYGSVDGYSSSWESKDGTKYYDRYHRWSGQHVYRRMKLEKSVWRGPMAGQPPTLHGHWKIVNYEAVNLRDAFTDVWYWYGEEITQGEWHLRNL